MLRIAVALVFAVSITLSLSSISQAQEKIYEFPDVASDLSTVYSGLIHVPKTESKSLYVRVLPSTAKLRRTKLRLRFYPAKQTIVGAEMTDEQRSPELLFVLSGLGSDIDTVYSKFYAQMAQEAGLNVVVVPNTLTPNFILSSSVGGLVGETPVDAVDLYRALQATVTELKSDHGIEVPAIKLLGFSHGALLAAAVDSLNANEQKLKVSSVLMVNPPVSLLYGLRNLDDRADAAKKIPLPKLIKFALKYRGMMKASKAQPTTIDTYNRFTKELRMSPEESYALIGLVMKMGLDKAIISGQRIDDLGILPELAPKGSVARRYDESEQSTIAQRYSFEEYIETFFGARAKRDGTSYSINALEMNSSLPAYEAYLRTTSHTFMVHNEDDLLLRKGDCEYLKSVLGERVSFYPRGGHMGNVWAKDNVKFIQKWFKL